MKVKWSAGDQIIVYGNGDSKTYGLSAGANTQTGTFTTTGGVQPADTYRAFYPAANCTGLSGDVFTFTMPATQTYTAGGFNNNLNPMAAKTNGGGATLLMFKNAFAVLKVSVKGSHTVSKVVLTVPSGNYVYGTYTFNYNTGATTRSSGGSNTLELTCGNGVTLNASTATDFYFVLPPGTLPSGSTIAFYQSGSNTPFHTTSSTTSAQTLARNHIYTATVNAEKYVTNLLPGLTTDYAGWTIEKSGYMYFANSNYANYGETFYPASTYCYALNASLSELECYIKSSSAIQYKNGHQYYLRWWSRKEKWSLDGSNWNTANMECFTQDFYWPIDENHRWVRLFTNPAPHTNYWEKHSRIISQTSSGSSKVRFDFNNGFNSTPFLFSYFCFSDPMLIDLTETYTNQGLAIPTQAQLDAKAYFVGTRTLSNW